MQPGVNPNLKTLDKRNMIYWIIIVGLPLLVMLIPISPVFTVTIRLFLAMTLCAILMFAFEVIPNFIPALALPVAYVLTNVAPAAAIYSPWSTYIPWMFLSGMLLANVLQSTGLLTRVSYWCILKTGGTYNRLLYGIMIAGLVLNIFLPGQLVIPFAAFTYGICMSLNLGQSKESSGIMITGAIAALLPLFVFYNPNFAIMQGIGAAVKLSPVTWLQYFIHNWPNLIFCFVMVWALTKVFKPEKNVDFKKFVTQEYAKLGPMTTPEKKSVFVTALLFLFMLTGSLHKIEIGWGFVFAACLAYLPGISIGSDADIRKCNFPMVFFVTACMAIGAVANALGLGKLLANAMVPIMANSGMFVTMLVVWLLIVVMNFLMTPLAMMATFTLPLTQVAVNLNISPLAFYYMIMHGCDQIIFPYEYALYLIFFSFGLIKLPDFAKAFGLKMVIDLVFLAAILIPYWMLIGFI